MTRRTLFLLLLSAALLSSLALWLASCSSGGRLAEEAASALLARTGSGSIPPWSMFGKNSLHTRLSEHTGPATSALKWKYNTAGDPFYSAPAIAADGTVYIGDIGSTTEAPKLYAIRADGTLKWTFTTTGSPTGPAVSPDGSTIYVGGSYNSAYEVVDNQVYAISSSGALRWTYTMDGGMICSPTLGADGTIYTVTYAGTFYALNSDGSLKFGVWVGTSRSSPAIASDGTIYLGTVSRVIALNPDGTQKWYYFTNGGGVSSPAIAADGTIYIGNGSNSSPDRNKLFAINPDGSLKWVYNTSAAVYSSPGIGPDGTVYVGGYDYVGGTYDGALYAINPADGSLRWSFEPPIYYSGVFDSPSIGADGTIYFGTSVGGPSSAVSFYALNPNGTQKWSYAMPGGAGTASAIGADGTVYTGTRGMFVTKRVKGKSVTTYTGGLFAFGPGTP